MTFQSSFSVYQAWNNFRFFLKNHSFDLQITEFNTQRVGIEPRSQGIRNVDQIQCHIFFYST